jgi:short-subunit dehydrogenase
MPERMDWAKMLGAGCFRDRTAVVTGASSGIGCDVARTLGAMGAQVAMLARRKELLDEIKENIESGGGRTLGIGVDVTRATEVREAVDRILESFGKIDVLVNSAGVLIPGNVESMQIGDLERMMAVNVYGTVNAIQAVLPSMRDRSRGNIVNIGSLAGRRGFPTLGGYCATKFALVGLSEALRVELYGSGVTVSMIMPGVIDTPMVRKDESKNFGLPENMLAMPPQWVTAAVISAIVTGMPEIDVPPGAALAEKIAAVFPALTDAIIAWGNILRP